MKSELTVSEASTLEIDKWDRRFLEMARLIASWSKDPSTQTGAVIVSPERTILSTGFNGFPQCMPDEAPLYANREEKYSRIVHCEMNALLFARGSVRGATVYLWPFLSCDRCAVHLLQAGVVRLVAPKLDTAAGVRWEPTFVKTRRYCAEARVECCEVDFA